MAEPALKKPRHKSVYSQNDLEAFNVLRRPIWVFDVDRKAMWWANDAALDLWNADTLESLIARDFTDMSEATEQRLQCYLKKFATTGESLVESWTYYPKNRGPKTCSVTVSGIHVDEGRLLMLNEADFMKESVDQSNLRGVEVLRHLPVPVGQFDAHGKVMNQNPESLKVFGGDNDDCDGGDDGDDNDECIGTTLVARFLDKQHAKHILHQVLYEGMDYNAEVQQHTKQGLRWFAVQLRQSKDPVDGQPVVIYSARDITAVVNAKREADQANMAKSEFIAVMGHELRTPLHQVIGFLELMGGTKLSDQQAEYIGLMETSAVSLMTVINDLLDYTKLEAGKMKMEQIPFDVRDVVAGVLVVIGPRAEQKDLCLSSQVDKKTPLVMGDPNRLRQLLLNFFQNAVKFTNVGGIALQVKRLTDDPSGRLILRFAVSDTGIGISPEHRSHIFNKYQQADASVARNFGGTGLGLAICKIIVETLGGNIGVDSIVGQGSTFWFEIPFLKSSTTGNKNRSSLSSQVERMPSLNVLVAEDNKVNQKLVVAVLKRLGHTATVVGTGKEAVEAVEISKYDLVLMDVQMPEMDGLEATQIIRQRGWTEKELPIIGLTADYRPAEKAKYQEIGMNDCLGKPLRMKDLRSQISRTVGRRS